MREDKIYRQVLILRNKESINPLTDAKGDINYEFERGVRMIFPTDSKADVPHKFIHIFSK